MQRESLQPVLFAKERQSMSEMPHTAGSPAWKAASMDILLPRFLEEKGVVHTCAGLKMQAVDVLKARD